MGEIIFKCYRCGSKDIIKEKNFCNVCKDETKLTKIEME
jgi:ribosomal protein L37E